MKTRNWREIAELIGITAIVASLIFVGLQLQQDRLLLRSELGAVTSELTATISLALGGSDVSRAWAKMLDRPEDLSVEEMLQVNSVLLAVRRMFLRECYLWAVGVFAECGSIIRGEAKHFFGNRYAQSWWRANKYENSYGTAAFIDEIITSVDVSHSKSILEDTKAGL